MEETIFGPSSFDVFPQPTSSKCCETQFGRKPKRLSVREIKIRRSEDCNTYAALTRHLRAKARWNTAFSLISSCGDPWEKFHLQELPEETAKRYRYHAIKGKWVEDIVHVKIENTPFNNGAMRECFRAKKLSNFSHCADWSHASNHVAKRYIEKVDPHVYFDDVRLQMDAKLWGEEYSRQPAVPKKVDISQMCVLEFINRSGKPLYHLEHFIEGTYRKYNSNSGFVDDLARNTPQAFSHFTFERSGHRLIVVDIQGVGNLWTDPQIHTFDGKSYGDGNLGIRGMALFFHTHRCNPLCVALELSSFDLPENEKFSPSFKQLPPVEADNRVKDNTQNNNHESLSKEVFSGTVAIPACRRSDYCFRRLISENLDSSYVRSKNDANNNNNGSANNDFVNPADFMESHSLPSSNLPFLPMNSPAVNCHGILRRDNISNTPVSANSINSGKRFAKNNGSRDVDLENRNSSDDLIFGPLSIHDMSYDSGISFDASSIGNAFKTQQSIGNGSCLEPFSSDLDQSNSQSNSLESSEKRSKEAELIEFFRSHQAGHRSSSVAALHGADRIILGLIHHELARLHASGRLASMHHPGYCQEIHSRLKANKPSTHLEDIDTSMLNELHPSQNVNWEAVLFHEEQSATLGCLDAIQCLAQYYLDLMIDGPLSECPIKPNLSDSRARGFALISTAASAGDRAAMIYLAEANFTGDIYKLDNSNGESSKTPDWLTAAHWYEMASKAVDCGSDDETNEFDESFLPIVKQNRVGFHSLSDWPIYRLQGRLAEMYAEGGYGLKRDRRKAYELYESAAEGATEALQGRIAMKYYEQAALLEEYAEGDEEN